MRRALMLAMFVGWSVTTLAASREFDIPESDATQAITRFAQQAGVPVLFDYDLVQGRGTRALRGSFEVNAGLESLLQGTGLVARTNRRGQLTIQRAPAASRTTTESHTQALADVQATSMNPELAEIAVTGTRIERDGMSMPTPVTVISRVELEAQGSSTLADALVQLPQFLNNDTAQSQSFGTTTAAGASFLNLRGIGTIRTLLLLDGRRMVPSSRLGTVDIALLPRNLVRRVDIVTGGASAAYGSDAVSGVVNLILDSDFRGLRAQVQGGLSDRGDYENQEFSLGWGGQLGDASNLLLSGEYFRAHGIRGYQSRDWFGSWAAISNPDPAGPGEIVAPNVHATGYTYGGLITSGPLAGTQFLPGGVVAPFVPGSLVTSTTQSGGSGVDPAEELIWMLPDQERASGFARLRTQHTAAFASTLQLLAAETRYHFQKDPPSLWGPLATTIYPDNAFLPAEIRDRMTDLGLTSFRMGREANGDLGDHDVQNGTSMVSGLAGFDWGFADWKMGGYYQYGYNQTRLSYHDTLRLDRIYRAVDSVRDPVTGNPVCRSTLQSPDDGCVPVNLFGQDSVSAAGRDWVTEGSSEQTQDVREQVAEVTAQADLPGIGGVPLTIVAGTSWRDESADTRSRRFPESLEGLRVEPAAAQGYRGLPASYSGQANIFERTSTVDSSGSYSVWEVFGEAMMPLLRDRAFAQRLDFHAALREARYSGSGTIPAWKGGLDWQVNDSLRFRATRSRDIRAGSLSERFDSSLSGTTIVDRVLPAEPTYAVAAVRLGNPEIDPEKSDTTTAGLVLTPLLLPGFSFSADYYDIRIHDAISQLGVQTTINRCAEGELELCAMITRNETTGLITYVRNDVLNVAQARSRGIDFEASWRGPVRMFGEGESLALRMFANRTFESSTIGASGELLDRAGQTGLLGGAPPWQVNLSAAYRHGPVEVTLQERLISAGNYNNAYGPDDIDNNHVDGVAYTNLRISWQSGSSSGLLVYLGLINLFDQDPPRAPDWGFGGSIATNESLFDVLGRRIVLGVRWEQ